MMGPGSVIALTSEPHYQLFLEHAPFLVFIKDEENRYIYGNQLWRRQFHRPPQELFGRTDEELWPAAVARQFRAGDDIVRTTKVFMETIESIPIGDLGDRWFAKIKFPLVAADGRTLVGGMAFDITDRRQAEMALQRQNALITALNQALAQFIAEAEPHALFARLLESLLKITESNYGMIGEFELAEPGPPVLKSYASAAVGPDGVVHKAETIDWNQLQIGTLESLFSADGSSGIGPPASEGTAASGSARPEDSAGLSRIGLPIRHAGTLLGLLYLAHRPGGYTQELVDLLQPVLSTCGHLIEGHRNALRRIRAEAALRRAHAELEDRVRVRTADLYAVNTLLKEEIAERQRTEGRLQELQNELAQFARLSTMGEMASELAHELNQPLAAISNYAAVCRRWIREGSFSTDKLLKGLGRIAEQSRYAGEVIRRIRGFLSRGQPQRVPTPAAEMINEALLLLEHELRRTAIRVDVHIAPDLRDVLADRIQIEQVILNLVRNAIDALQGATREDREIRIRARSEGDRARIEVADRGQGIAAAMRARLFEPFQSTKPRGMGMGLAISKSIVEAHGGMIGAESLPRGALFWLTLPLATPAAESAGELQK